MQFIGGRDDPYEAAEDRLVRVRRLEAQCLNELRLKQLKMWLDEDSEKITSKVLLITAVGHTVYCVVYIVLCSVQCGGAREPVFLPQD